MRLAYCNGVTRCNAEHATQSILSRHRPRGAKKKTTRLGPPLLLHMLFVCTFLFVCFILFYRETLPPAWYAPGSVLRAALRLLYRPADGTGDETAQIHYLRAERAARKWTLWLASLRASFVGNVTPSFVSVPYCSALYGTSGSSPGWSRRTIRCGCRRSCSAPPPASRASRTRTPS